MIVHINNQQDIYEIDADYFEETTNALAEACSLASHQEVGITFTDDIQMKELNSEYRDLDKTTDVLAFSMTEGEDLGGENNPDSLGDIVISIETAADQAASYRAELSADEGLRKELLFLLIHGFLHLMGNDHQTDEEADIMEAKEAELLEQLW